jgi:acyl dehydratase
MVRLISVALRLFGPLRPKFLALAPKAVAEGLALQTGLLHGPGLALLSYDVRVLAPVLAGDTISVEIEVLDRRETGKPDRGVVTFRHRIANQRGEVVMEATIARMIKRRGPGDRPRRSAGR